MIEENLFRDWTDTFLFLFLLFLFLLLFLILPLLPVDSFRHQRTSGNLIALRARSLGNETDTDILYLLCRHLFRLRDTLISLAGQSPLVGLASIS